MKSAAKPRKKGVVVFIVGPTAIGKTALAVRLARRIGGEIVSADSMQVYRGVTILSQAPSVGEKKSARHHLIGILSPDKEYSVAVFRKNALIAIRSIIKKGKIPIVAGGSGLYIKVLTDGLFPAPPADAPLRKRLAGYAARYGSPALHKRLERIDPQASNAIHPNDLRRIIRALEIYHSTGRTMTELKSETKGLGDSYKIRIFGLTRPREALYSAIERRVDRIFRAGVVKEVRRLDRRRLSKTARAILGYKEISGYLNGSYGLEEAKELLKKNTRRFAKRQLTWFRADKRIGWFDLLKTSPAAVISKMMKEIV